MLFFMTTTILSSTESPFNNPLLQKWSGPYGGVPSFDKYRVSDFQPAIEFAIQENLNELDAIANNLETPTFKNTIAALENSGKTIAELMLYMEYIVLIFLQKNLEL